MAKGNNSKKVAVGVGLGLAAMAAAGAGFYFYGSKSATANRRKVSKWATDLQKDVLKSAKKLKKLDQRAYATIVDEATKAYKSVKSIDQRDLESAALELKQNWAVVEKELNRTVRSGVKKATKTAKKVVAKAKKATAPKKSAKKVVAKKKS